MTEHSPQILEEMPERNPVNGTFELTIRCNLHCKMCLFRHDDSENPEIMAKELTTEQWIDMARQAAEAGTMNLLITGGEPMLRPDFCEIWEGIYKQGFIITLYTNATLVTPKIMETLKKCPPHKIGVTIYGTTPGTYQNVCGAAKAFEQMITGIHSLLQLPSQIEFRMTVIQENKNDVIPIEQFVRKEFGENHSVIMSSIVYRSVRDACTDVDSCRLSPQELAALNQKHIQEMARNALEGKIDVDQFQINYVRKKKQPECQSAELSLFGCRAGMSQYTVTWAGKLLGCQLLGLFSTDVLESGFRNAWEQYPYKVKLPPENLTCKTCDVADYCQKCSAFCYAETGQLNGCSKYIYLNAHAQKEKY